jgi:preprotein translocase subunit SecA
MLQRLGLKEDEAIVHPWVNKALEKAQQKVEARNFEIRKQLLKYDDVMNDQRKVIYEQRKELMRTSDVSGTVEEMRHEVIDLIVSKYIPANSYAEQWDAKGLHEEAMRVLGLDLPFADWVKEEGIADQQIRERLVEASDARMMAKEEAYSPEVMRMAEKGLLLQILDQSWKEHLLALDHLRHGIGLRAYGQRDPLNEYKREAFDMFQSMLDRLRETITQVLSHIEIRVQRPDQTVTPPPQPRRISEGRVDPALGDGGGAAAPARQPAMVGAGGPAMAQRRPNGATPAAQRMSQAEVEAELAAGRAVPSGPIRRTAAPQAVAADPSTWGKVARNAPCPCGSGKKFKHCHGQV